LGIPIFTYLPSVKKGDNYSQAGFKKAFDSVEHEAILSMFCHKGFLDKWVTWLKDTSW
jgi:hypothetical protein